MLNLTPQTTELTTTGRADVRHLFLVSIGGLASAGATVVLIATLAGFAGRFWWVFDIFSHFRVQYFLLSAVVSLVLLICRRFRSISIAVLCLAINLGCLAPYYWPVSDKIAGNSRVLRVASVNVNTGNQQYELVSRLALSDQPDVLLLTEVNAAWIKAMETIAPLYPYQKHESREDNFGIALYSKHAFAKAEMAYFGEALVPSIVAEIEVEGRTVTIVGTHALPPISGIYARYRDRQLEDLGNYLGTARGPRLLLGDLNASPWSYAFRRLLDQSSLRDSSIGRGIMATWPSNSILFRIPIDFCLVSDEIAIKERLIGPDVGSDHDPLIVELAVN